MSDSPTLGTLIREQRLDRGLSLGQLATKLGHTAASVRRWERGEDLPSASLLTKLAEVLGLEENAVARAMEVTPLAGSGQPEPTKPQAAPAPQAATAPEAAPKPAPKPAPEPAAAAPEPAPKPAPEPAAAAAPPPETAAKPAAGDPEESRPLPTPDEPRRSEGDTATEPAAPEPVGTEGDARTDRIPQTPAAAARSSEQTPRATPPAAPVEAARSPVAATNVVAGPARSTPERPADITEAPTEAVPVVPQAGRVAGPAPQVGGTSGSTSAIPPRPAFENPFRVLFDPNRRWLYWIRLALLITAGIILLSIFVWALGELWDSLGELLDTIGSTEPASEIDPIDDLDTGN